MRKLMMKLSFTHVCALCCLVIATYLIPQTLFAEPAPVQPSTQAVTSTRPVQTTQACGGPQIDDRARRVLTEMGRLLAKAERLHVKVHQQQQTFDTSMNTELLWDWTVYVQRPNKLAMFLKYPAIIGATVISDGITAYSYRPDNPERYSEDVAPKTFDEFRGPLAFSDSFFSLLLPEPEKALLKGAEHVTYIGTEVCPETEVKTHHIRLVYFKEVKDIWVKAEPEMAPLRVLRIGPWPIKDSHEKKFQEVVTLSDWEINKPIPHHIFKFVPPAPCTDGKP